MRSRSAARKPSSCAVSSSVPGQPTPRTDTPHREAIRASSHEHLRRTCRHSRNRPTDRAALPRKNATRARERVTIARAPTASSGILSRLSSHNRSARSKSPVAHALNDSQRWATKAIPPGDVIPARHLERFVPPTLGLVNVSTEPCRFSRSSMARDRAPGHRIGGPSGGSPAAVPRPRRTCPVARQSPSHTRPRAWNMDSRTRGTLDHSG